jgi:hypothetical protein
MSGVLKSQIDWIPLNSGAIRPTQGKTLAVMQVSGGSQSFNAVNQMRVLGRWMRMLTVPNQSSVAKAFQEFDEAGRMKPSSFYDRVVDVMGAGQVHAAHARCLAASDRSLQRARGIGGGAFSASQPAKGRRCGSAGRTLLRLCAGVLHRAREIADRIWRRVTRRRCAAR